MGRFFPKGKHHGKYKSGLEREFASLATAQGLKFEYEPTKFAYARPSHYVPDWRIAEGVYIETKGWLAPFQRAGLLAFQQQYPQVRILLLFGNSQNRLNAGSKTTYGQWAERHGFEWADFRKGIPVHWWEKYAEGYSNVTSKRKTKNK